MTYTPTAFTANDCDQIRLLISHELTTADITNAYIQSAVINLAANVKIDANFKNHDQIADPSLLPDGIDENVSKVRMLAMRYYAAYLLIDGYSDVKGENIGAGWDTDYSSIPIADKKQRFLEEANSFITNVYRFAPEDDPFYFRPEVAKIPSYSSVI